MPSKYQIESCSGGNAIKGDCREAPDEGLFQGFSASGPDVWLTSYDFEKPGVVLSAVGARCGKTFKADGHWGVVANTHCLFPRRSADRDFLWYLTNDELWWEKGGTAQPFVKVSDSLLRKQAFPPNDEQRAIAAFLDRETAKIDALVEEQRRLIELLKEKRQAVISHAVTKGLDPSAPMKDSGVEWLGEVPVHWEVRRFSRLVRIAEGQVDPRTEPYASMLLIAPNHIESGTGRLLAMETAADQGADSGKYQFDAGDVLYSKIRPALAKAVLAPTAGLCSADMYPLRSQGELDQAYLHQLLLTPGFTAWASLESERVAMPKINRDKLNELKLPVPPAEEQAQIVLVIANRLRAFDQLSLQAGSAITFLQERRAALISAAVTGKIDVRGLAQTEGVAA
jgi:type I restriction enzyme S subunit